MKFSAAALVLATLAVESASAATLRHAHRHLHQKKEAKVADKRDGWTPPPGYDPHWTPPAGYNPYASSADNAASTPAPAPASTVAASPAESSPAKSSPASSSGDNSDDSSLGGIFKNAMTDLQSLISGANLKLTNTKGLGYLADGTVMTGLNAKAPGQSFVWLGDDSSANMVNEMCNESGEDITVAVWKTSGGDYSTQFVTSSQPAIAVKIPSGSSIKLSFSDESGAWAPIYGDTAMAWTGMIHNTFGEFTVSGGSSYFDVSREPAAAGNDMTIEADECKSTSLGEGECMFKCTAFEDSKGGDWCVDSYTLVTNSNNCNPGYDPKVQGVSGACKTTTKKIKTTFH